VGRIDQTQNLTLIPYWLFVYLRAIGSLWIDLQFNQELSTIITCCLCSDIGTLFTELDEWLVA